MIRSFQHRGLRRLYERGDVSGIRPDLLDNVRTILHHLDASESVDGMRLPGLRLHALKGDLKGYFAVSVNANWRIVFRFQGGDAHDVKLVDYH